MSIDIDDSFDTSNYAVDSEYNPEVCYRSCMAEHIVQDKETDKFCRRICRLETNE
jgi:hypothetical protein